MLENIKAEFECKIEKHNVKKNTFKFPRFKCMTVLNLETNKSENIFNKLKGVIKFNHNIGDIIKKGEELLSVYPCEHGVLFDNSFCGVCGETISGGINSQIDTNNRYAICHGRMNVSVDEKTAMSISLDDSVNLLNLRKLVLLVDLDNTILHTTNNWNDQQPNKDVFSYILKDENNKLIGGKHFTKTRPGLVKFLEEMSELYQMQIFTFGNRSYALTIQKQIDPTKKYFNDRITSRDDSFDLRKKTANLKSLFPRGDKMVAIIDDRIEVWNDAANLVQVKSYFYFPNVGDINDPNIAGLIPNLIQQHQDPSSTQLPDIDDYLVHLARILKDIHYRYYQEYDTIVTKKNLLPAEIVEKDLLPDIKHIMTSIRSQIFTGCRVALSGIIPVGKKPESNLVVQTLKKLGAYFQPKLILPEFQEDSFKLDESVPYTTHLMCVSESGTDKIKKACDYIKQINKFINQNSKNIAPVEPENNTTNENGDDESSISKVQLLHRLDVVNTEWLWKSYFLWEATPEVECLLYPQIHQITTMPEGLEQFKYSYTYPPHSHTSISDTPHQSTSSGNSHNKRKVVMTDEDIASCFVTKKPRHSPEDRTIHSDDSSSTDDNDSSDSSLNSNDSQFGIIERNLIWQFSMNQQQNVIDEVNTVLIEEKQRIRQASHSPQHMSMSSGASSHDGIIGDSSSSSSSSSSSINNSGDSSSSSSSSPHIKSRSRRFTSSSASKSNKDSNQLHRRNKSNWERMTNQNQMENEEEEDVNNYIDDYGEDLSEDPGDDSLDQMFN